MFSNLVSYLGYATTSAKDQAENGPAEMRLRAVEENDWVLVERNEKEGLPKEAEEDTEMMRVILAASTCPTSLPGSSKGISRSASLDIINPLQESWYLAPPPSFSSEAPVHMETSPLENLLIEHPSMSVYEHSLKTETSSKKMSHSSPSGTSASEEDHPITLLPINENMYKIPRNKHSVKMSKKQTSTSSNPTPAVPSETEKTNETKEIKMKNFVKSPRRSINSELQSLPKKAPRKRLDNSKGIDKISKTSEDVVRKEEDSFESNTPARRLYSEVLASKPKEPTVQASTLEQVSLQKNEDVKNEEKPEPVLAVSEPLEEASGTVSEIESDMSVEENVDDASERSEERDRRKVVQNLPDRQHRLHFLNRSAQKVNC